MQGSRMWMPSAAEAFFLSGSDDLSAAAQRFVELGAKACVIKNGRRGAFVMLDGREHLVPAFAVTALPVPAFAAFIVASQ